MLETHRSPGHTTPPPHEVIQLREWGSERAHLLSENVPRRLVGTEAACAVCLDDPAVMPLHAQLVRERRRWKICSLGEAPGLQQDGARCNTFALEPGVQICLGTTTLVAESPHWICLRAFCARLLGWGAERLPAVEQALQAIRRSSTHQAPLYLHGESDLVPIAHALHRRSLGPDRPFIVCDTRRKDTEQSVRSATNYATARDALEAATGGSLCVRTQRLPPDFASTLASVSNARLPAQLILCSNRLEHLPPATSPIVIPSLAARSADLPRIVEEYVYDAALALQLPADGLGPPEREWILAHASSLPEIEKATLRLLALRAAPNLLAAAERLNMATVSLRRWLRRRAPLPWLSELNDGEDGVSEPT
jgi:Inner membrane component of T3SS, cytoplasmic domain